MNDREKSLKLCLAIMAAVDGNGFKLEDDISAKISGFRKEYDNDRDSRDEYGKSLWSSHSMLLEWSYLACRQSLHFLRLFHKAGKIDNYAADVLICWLLLDVLEDVKIFCSDK